MGGPKAPETEKQPVLLGTLASGQQVFDRFTSHIHSNEKMETILREAFANINLVDEEFVRTTVIFDKPIGTTPCISTTEKDSIVYAQRQNRRGLSRFVLERQPEETSTLCIILKKIPAGYIVLTAFTGSPAAVEPWDPNAGDDAKDFWSSHALLWGTEKTVPGTETRLPSKGYWEKLPSDAETNMVRQPLKDIRITIPI